MQLNDYQMTSKVNLSQIGWLSEQMKLLYPLSILIS